ncbi:flavin reductase family protein [Flavobacterium aurantiibacter]|uniref:Flavin oxidoreductase n=1 Tax=Flavobacterium aurantiibacter TaxID=2023067 RepID=A0A255ZKB0_9FLAO|nr:flavin reductase [Flavobacterium aurantiibacter]OYQ41963.1 flavin oxidoreductase [Flavobacterium aurantiibacter]
MKIDTAALEQLETRYRTAFINSLAGFRQAVLVGTKSESGTENLAIFNSVIHLGANPALLGLLSRPHTVPRDTLENMLATTFYTLNYVAATHYKAAHQTSARYDKGVSEFEQVGFTPEYHDDFYAPYVQEAVVQIGMKLETHIPIPLNGTVLLVGSIQHIRLADDLVGADGFVHLSDADVLVSQGLDAYFRASAVGRLPYAKP